MFFAHRNVSPDAEQSISITLAFLLGRGYPLLCGQAGPGLGGPEGRERLHFSLPVRGRFSASGREKVYVI